MIAAGSYADWWLGLAIGFAIVVVVVVVVAVILSYATKIGDQAGRAAGGLEEVRAGTAALWEVRDTNNAAVAILEATRTTREAVAAKLTGSAPPQAAAPPTPPASTRAGAPSAAHSQGGVEPPGVPGPESYPSQGGRGFS